MVKIYSHRGYVEGASEIEQNTIASLHNAYKNNFRKIEFDLWFLEGNFFLNHDQPHDDHLEKLPSLSDYFFYGNEMQYWLDFKNMNEGNVEAAAIELQKAIKLHEIALENIIFAPLIFDFNQAQPVHEKLKNILGKNIQIAAVQKILTPADSENYYKILKKNGVKFLSIFHELIDQKFSELFCDIKLLAWTVNDKKRMQELAQLGVYAIASDKIIPN